MWISTPIVDAAKYPYRTCPMCRVRITECERPQPSRELLRRVERGRYCDAVRRSTGLGLWECVTGVQRLMSEEIVVGELGREVEVWKKGGDVESDVLDKAEEVLKRKMEELRGEKEVWRFQEVIWERLRGEWMDKGMDL